MFLDEARIVAGIRHPNVVHVQDLIAEGDDLFLILEYLEGETAAQLLARARARGRALPPAVCAYIAAEACAGLHAAHELTGPSGVPQNLVHRDVSPSNLFVTYDGTVKVLDFGVAKAADRIGSTEAGELKGKFAYMSPEQARGLEVDRRSDVYSLGLVLYELTTGKNPIRRPTDTATLEAASAGAPPPPSESTPGYPADLQAVVMRALARERDARHATAAEMRRELLATLHATGADASAEDELAAIMHELFADQIAQKQDLLQRVSRVSSSGGPAPAVRAAPEPATATLSRTEAPAQRRARWPAVAALLAVAVLAGVVLARRALQPAADRCATPAIRVGNLHAEWTTPNTIRWRWDADGAPGDLLRFEVRVGRQPGEGPGTRAWTEAQSPELGRFTLPRTQSVEPVRATITGELEPDTLYYGRVTALDTHDCRSTSGWAPARTAVPPWAEQMVFHDDVTGRGSVTYRYQRATEGPHQAGAAHMEYHPQCPEGFGACHQNLKLVPDQPIHIRPGQFAQAFLEFAISCSGKGASFWSEVLLCLGDCRQSCERSCTPGCLDRCAEIGNWDYSPLTFGCGDGAYRVVQIPLRALMPRAAQRCPGGRGPCKLSAELMDGKQLTGVNIGGMWPRDSIVRIDEVRIRW
jgi:hypothetical protein